MKARALDKLFDAGGDVSAFLDLARARRTNETPRRVNVDFPAWMIHSLDKEAGRWESHVSRSSRSGFPNAWPHARVAPAPPPPQAGGYNPGAWSTGT